MYSLFDLALHRLEIDHYHEHVQKSEFVHFLYNVKKVPLKEFHPQINDQTILL